MIASFFSLIWIGVVVFLVLRGIRATSGRNRTSQSQTVTGHHQNIPVNRMPQQLPQQTVRNSQMNTAQLASAYKREKPTHKNMEDRSNDWLAKELRDERRALGRVSDMFEQQMEHRQHCDAKTLREYHLDNCDVGGIDTGAGR